MSDRLEVRKTSKLFVDGAFPRSESGRSYVAEGAWVAQASRKDLRDAVRAARRAWPGWAARPGYNRGQILYRVAEMLEARSGEFDADEAAAAVDAFVWYAGWCDKLGALSGTVSDVAAPYVVFTIPESLGVVGVVAPTSPPLLGLVARLAPVLCGGNTAVVIASETSPAAAVILAEVLATADVPPGVVNILTGRQAELTPWLAGHLDVDGLDLTGAAPETVAELESLAAEGVKRTLRRADAPTALDPYDVLGLMEMKTIWHPAGA